MTAGETLFDIWSLSSLSCRWFISPASTQLQKFPGRRVPAPGGPIKTILTEPVEEGAGPPEAWLSLSSSCLTLDSSLLTSSCSDCTVSSPIGAIERRSGYRGPDQGRARREEKGWRAKACWEEEGRWGGRGGRGGSVKMVERGGCTAQDQVLRISQDATELTRLRINQGSGKWKPC